MPGLTSPPVCASHRRHSRAAPARPCANSKSARFVSTRRRARAPHPRRSNTAAPSNRHASLTSPAAMRSRTREDETIRPRHATGSAINVSNPYRSPNCLSVAVSPACLCPNRKPSPTTTSFARIVPATKSRTNSSGVIFAISPVNGSAKICSTPARSSSAVRSAIEVSRRGARSGATTQAG